MKTCYYCGQDKDDTRPYGPGGSCICYGCTVSTPEREAAAMEMFLLQMDAAREHSPVVVIGEDGGVRPATPEEINQMLGEDTTMTTLNPDQAPLH